MIKNKLFEYVTPNSRYQKSIHKGGNIDDYVREHDIGIILNTALSPNTTVTVYFIEYGFTMRFHIENLNTFEF